ncbi:HtrL protein family-containing protein [Aphelenchoides besseyi]|nr:HtrL protein family-containing protein [Aphelenchoides besseyi]KAI6198953.1 HtrL protein family-containing protein [Aphelenchoides besseyi]
MKSAELDALVNSSNTSTVTSSGRSNGNSATRNRNGFPPITRESRRRTRRWLLLLLLALLLLFLGWRFFIRPLLVAPTDESFLIQTTTTIKSSVSSTQRPTTTQPTTQSTAPPTTEEDVRPEIMLRPPEITWNAGTEKPTIEIQSTFDIRADFKNQTSERNSQAKSNGQFHPRIHAVLVGQQSGRAPSNSTTRARVITTTRRPTSTTPPTTTATSSTVEDDEDLTWFPHKLKSQRPPRPTTSSTRIVSSTTSRSRPSDGSYVIHPHANSAPARQPLAPETIIDNDLRDVISQVDNSKSTTTIPPWRIEPPDMKPPTAGPKPSENYEKPKISVSATVHTYQRGSNGNSTGQQRNTIKWGNSPVMVTALLDIGRGDWQRFTRHYDIYLSFLMNLLRLQNRFVIYCDKTACDFLRKQKQLDLKSRIELVQIQLSDLPFYQHRAEIVRILDEEQQNWREDWDRRFKEHPEAMFPDYNILVNSKPYLMENATQSSRFRRQSKFFVWVDAGYGHGSKTDIPDGLWDPELPEGKITLIKVTPEYDRPEKYDIKSIYRKRVDVICGGFLAGDVPTIRRFHVFFFKTFMELLDNMKIDDDQITLLFTIKNYTSTFNILFGGWFDGFLLLPSRPVDQIGPMNLD